MRCIQITDIHLDPRTREPQDVPAWEQFNWALQTARELEPHLVVITGDIALDYGSPEIYRSVAKLLDSWDSHVLLLPGNHDRRDAFHEAFGRRYLLTDQWPLLDRTVEIEGHTMFLLDTADGCIHERSLAWLDTVLESRAAAVLRGGGGETIIIWMHHPPVTGFHRFMDQNYALKNGTDFIRICGRYRDRLRINVFCGHYHTEHRTAVENITQYCTPSTWVQLDPTASDIRVISATPAIRIVDIDETGTIETAVIEPADTAGEPAR